LFPSAKDKTDGSFTVYCETLELRLDKPLSENPELGVKMNSLHVINPFCVDFAPQYYKLWNNFLENF
jgi:hypothetical protein